MKSFDKMLMAAAALFTAHTTDAKAQQIPTHEARSSVVGLNQVDFTDPIANLEKQSERKITFDPSVPPIPVVRPERRREFDVDMLSVNVPGTKRRMRTGILADRANDGPDIIGIEGRIRN